MKQFIKKILFLGIITMGVLYIIMHIQRNYVWQVTNSISMDAKMWYVNKLDIKNVDVVGVGSSMTLNNLNTEAVLNCLSKEDTFFNYGAWGLQISDTKIILENVLQTTKPKSVIIFSNIVDFYGDVESRYKDADFKNYMDGMKWNDIAIVLKYGYPHNEDTIELWNDYKDDKAGYRSLDFDSNGGVALEVYGENIDSTRWNQVLEGNSVNELQYTALEELCQLAYKEDIRLYFVQTPYREHYVSNSGVEQMNKHKIRCKEIVEKYGQIYWCTDNMEAYEDTLFCDYIHLNKEGSYLFTMEFMKYFNECEIH